MSYFDLLDEAPSTCIKFVHKGGVQMAAQGLKVFLAKVYVSFETCLMYVYMDVSVCALHYPENQG